MQDELLVRERRPQVLNEVFLAIEIGTQPLVEAAQCLVDRYLCLVKRDIGILDQLFDVLAMGGPFGAADAGGNAHLLGADFEWDFKAL